MQPALEKVDGARRLEREPSSQHPVEDDPERVHVARRRDGLSGRLLRRHVRGCADQRARLGERVGARDPGDSEVRDPGAAFLVEDDVRRLQIAVDEAVLMRMGEARGDLGRD